MHFLRFAESALRSSLAYFKRLNESAPSRSSAEFFSKPPHEQAAEQADDLMKRMESAIKLHDQYAKHAETHKHSSLKHYEDSSKSLKGYLEAMKTARAMIHNPELRDHSSELLHKVGLEILTKPEHHELGRILQPKLPYDLAAAVQREQNRPRLKSLAKDKKGPKAPEGFVKSSVVYSSREDLEKQAAKEEKARKAIARQKAKEAREAAAAKKREDREKAKEAKAAGERAPLRILNMPRRWHNPDDA